MALTASLTLWRSRLPVMPQLQRVLAPELPVQSFAFEYTSSSYLNPALPGSKNAGGGITIACQSKGMLHAVSEAIGELTFIYEFSEILCGEADVIAERGLSRSAQFSREFLASVAAVQRATEDPALAVARTIFLHLDAGLRPAWPAVPGTLVNREQRIEGEVTPELRFAREADGVSWTKHFSGTVPSSGLQNQIEYQVDAHSQLAQPIELGLMNLHGTERSISLQNKHLVARTDIQVRVLRAHAINRLALQSLLSELKADVPTAAPKILSAEEKQQLIQRWRQFRDGDGQKPAAGESEANQPEYLELKQALRQDPTIADELAVDLNEMDPASSGFATLSGALIYSGEAEALDAFVEQAAKHKDSDDWQSRAVPMIGLAPRPTEQSWKYLDAMRKQAKQPEIAGSAELGMATHLKRGYEDPKFVNEIGARLQAAQTEADRLHLLDLIGNAGLDQYLPTMETWIPGSSLALRLRIAQALRFMTLPKAEDILLQMAAAPDIELSLTALQSLRDRTVQAASIPVLLQLLARSNQDRVRLKVLENLYEARQLDAGLLQKVHELREKSNLSPALAEAWDQIEKDWVEPVET